VETTEPKNLLTEYRPADFDQIYGHADVVRQLSGILNESAHPHAFLLTGPSGVGKTSIARIIGLHLNAFIDEIDVANAPGADEMRNLMDRVTLFPLGSKKRRLVIVDECHTISNKGWQAVLKTVEEPPPHLYFAFCTTDTHKVPKTIATRCVHFDLKPLSTPELINLVEVVAGCEGWELFDGIARAIAIASEGSPRHSLALLARYHDATSPDQIDRTSVIVESTSGIVRLLRILLDENQTPTWKSVQAVLEDMDDSEINNWIYPAQEYLCKVMTTTRSLHVKDICTELLHGIVQQVAPEATMKARLFRFLGKVVSH